MELSSGWEKARLEKRKEMIKQILNELEGGANLTVGAISKRLKWSDKKVEGIFQKIQKSRKLTKV